MMVGAIFLPTVSHANWDDYQNFVWEAHLNAPLDITMGLCGVCTEDGTPSPSYCDLNLSVPVDAYSVATFTKVSGITTVQKLSSYVKVTKTETNTYYNQGAGQNPGTTRTGILKIQIG
jgi:hypothetical protein